MNTRGKFFIKAYYSGIFPVGFVLSTIVSLTYASGFQPPCKFRERAYLELMYAKQKCENISSVETLF